MSDDLTIHKDFKYVKNQNNQLSSIKDNKNKQPMKSLEEILPETTEEGYGLRTPYGTHLNLDFVKYCEDITNRNLMKIKKKSDKNNQLLKKESKLQTCPDIIKNLHEEIKSSEEAIHLLQSNVINAKQEKLLNDTRTKLEGLCNRRSITLKTAENITDIRKSSSTKTVDMKKNEKCSSSGSRTPSSSNDRTPSSVEEFTYIPTNQLYLVRDKFSQALSRLRMLENEVPQLQETIKLLENEKKILEEKYSTACSKTNLKDKAEESSSQYSSLSSSNDSMLLEKKNISLKSRPPIPPSRKYKSQSCGDDICIWDVKMVRNLLMANVKTQTKHCSQQIGKNSLTKAEVVDKCVGESIYTSATFYDNKNETDMCQKLKEKLFDIVQPVDQSCQTERKSMKNVETSALPLCSVQATSTSDLTVKVITKNSGCDPIHIEKPKYKTVGVGTSMPPVHLHQSTSSDDLIKSSSISVGTCTNVKCISTNTEVSFDPKRKTGICLKSNCNVATMTNFSRPVLKSTSSGITQSVVISRGTNTSTPQQCNLATQTKTELPNSQQITVDRSTCTFTHPGKDACVGNAKFVVERGTDSLNFNLHSKTTQTCITSEDSTESIPSSHISEFVGKVESLIQEQEDLLVKQDQQQVVEEEIIEEKKVIPEGSFSSEDEEILNNINVVEFRGGDATMSSSMSESTKPVSIMKKPGSFKCSTKSLKFAEEVQENSFSSDDEEEEEISPLLNESSEDCGVRGKFQSRPLTLPIATESFLQDSLHGSSAINVCNSQEEIMDYMNDDARLFKQATIESDTSSCSSNEVQSTSYHFFDGLREACKVLNCSLENNADIDENDLLVATHLLKKEFFDVAAQPDSLSQHLQIFVHNIQQVASEKLFKKIINMTDDNGNNVLHYALSHGQIKIVEVLLQLEGLDVNHGNQAGYTPSMLAALCNTESDYQQNIFRRLFTLSDVNKRAKEAGQTALMLACSHSKVNTCKLLMECGAHVNLQDDDGSTALMCAAEENQSQIVKLLLDHPDCKPEITDKDGSTALSIALSKSHKETSLLLYAKVHINKSPSTNIKKKKIPQRKSSQSMLPRPVRHVKL